MRKRDRTPEERQIDRLTRAGMMKLGPAAPLKKEAFPFVMFWEGKHGRKGQRCKVIESNMRVADIEFEDGFRDRVPRRAIRRFQKNYD